MTTNTSERNAVPLGATGVQVSQLCAGSGTWKPDRFGSNVPVAESVHLIHQLFESSQVNYLDTSNSYGLGESERRIGIAVREHGGTPADFDIQTKADRDMRTGDFSGARMRRSLEESMERTGLDHLPIVFLHDPENTTRVSSMADDGPVAALDAARAEGMVGHLGISG